MKWDLFKNDYKGPFNNYVTIVWVGGVMDFVTIRYEKVAWVGGVEGEVLRNGM